MNSTLAVKVALAPALIASVSLLQRRLGPSIGGLFTGTPVMAGPVLLALGLDHGPNFAAAAAAGGLQAMAAVSLFASFYATAAVRWRLTWVLSLISAFIAYSIGIGLIIVLPLSLLASLVVTTVSQWIVIRTMPLKRGVNLDTRTAPPWWDIPLRMALAALLVWTVAAVSERAGARLSGLLSPFPVATTVLAVFTHRHDGAAACAGFLRGLMFGMTSLAVFFAVAALSLSSVGMVSAFAISTLASLATSAALWGYSRR